MSDRMSCPPITSDDDGPSPYPRAGVVTLIAPVLPLPPQPVLCRRARPCTSASCDLARRADLPRYRDQKWFGNELGHLMLLPTAEHTALPSRR
jgi:hypothetical protein